MLCSQIGGIQRQLKKVWGARQEEQRQLQALKQAIEEENAQDDAAGQKRRAQAGRLAAGAMPANFIEDDSATGRSVRSLLFPANASTERKDYFHFWKQGLERCANKNFATRSDKREYQRLWIAMRLSEDPEAYDTARQELWVHCYRKAQDRRAQLSLKRHCVKWD